MCCASPQKLTLDLKISKSLQPIKPELYQSLLVFVPEKARISRNFFILLVATTLLLVLLLFSVLLVTNFPESFDNTFTMKMYQKVASLQKWNALFRQQKNKYSIKIASFLMGQHKILKCIGHEALHFLYLFYFEKKKNIFDQA